MPHNSSFVVAQNLIKIGYNIGTSWDQT